MFIVCSLVSVALILVLPVASFSISPANPEVYDTITFTADRPDGTGYSWIFDDGSTSTGDPVTHTFSRPGTYVVTLTYNKKKEITADKILIQGSTNVRTTVPITVATAAVISQANQFLIQETSPVYVAPQRPDNGIPPWTIPVSLLVLGYLVYRKIHKNNIRKRRPKAPPSARFDGVIVRDTKPGGSVDTHVRFSGGVEDRGR